MLIMELGFKIKCISNGRAPGSFAGWEKVQKKQKADLAERKTTALK
jgi:hypothetical protein